MNRLDLDLITNNKHTGRVGYIIPINTVDGIEKLAQRIIVVLLADEGSLISYATEGAIASTIDDNVLALEASRVLEDITADTKADAPDTEVLADLTLSLESVIGSSVVIEAYIISKAGYSITESVKI